MAFANLTLSYWISSIVCRMHMLWLKFFHKNSNNWDAKRFIAKKLLIPLKYENLYHIVSLWRVKGKWTFERTEREESGKYRWEGNEVYGKWKELDE